MGKRIINRTYINKTTGEVVSKQYEYGKRGGDKFATIVGKGGKIYEDRLKSLLSEVDDLATKTDIKATVKQWARNHKGESLNTKRLASMVETNKLKKMFINAGYEPSEAAKGIGVNEADLFNQENWDGSKFYLDREKGIYFEFVFDYYDSVWRRSNEGV